MIKAVLIFIISVSAFNSEGEEKSTEEKKPAEKIVKDELLEAQTEVSKREAKVKSLREEIKKMIEEKNALANSDVQRHSEIMKTIEENYARYRTEYEELQGAKTRLRFRFPDKTKKQAKGEPEENPKAESGEHGKDAEAKATDSNSESLKKLESESNLDVQLSDAIAVMRQKYKRAQVPHTQKAQKETRPKKEDGPSDIITIQK